MLSQPRPAPLQTPLTRSLTGSLLLPQCLLLPMGLPGPAGTATRQGRRHSGLPSSSWAVRPEGFLPEPTHSALCSPSLGRSWWLPGLLVLLPSSLPSFLSPDVSGHSAVSGSKVKGVPGCIYDGAAAHRETGGGQPGWMQLWEGPTESRCPSLCSAILSLWLCP